MTELGDTIMKGLDEIKRLRAGEKTGAKVHKMTNDEQIEAAFAAYMADFPDSAKLQPHDWDMIKAALYENYKAGYQTALEASHAQYVPMLVEALREVVRKTKQEQACIQELDSHVKSYAISQMHQLHQLVSEALANLPEELRG